MGDKGAWERDTVGGGYNVPAPNGEAVCERGKPLVSDFPRDRAAGTAIAGGPGPPGDVGRRSVPRTPEERARGYEKGEGQGERLVEGMPGKSCWAVER